MKTSRTGGGTRRWFIVIAAAVWVVLVLVLTAAEKGVPGSRINSLGDALWYSLVTMSTVGYGDMVPVTPLGRAVGVVFVLMGTGLFALLIGIAFSLLSGQILSGLRLRLGAGRNKYIFNVWNDQSRALTEHIVREDPRALAVYLKASQDALPGARQLHLEAAPEQAAALALRGRGRVSVFLMDEQVSDLENAIRLSPLGVPVYCRVDSEPPWAVPNVSFFSPSQCCARRYWQEHPAASPSEQITFIGSGRLCRELLEQALLVNVYGERQAFVYHVIGDMDGFLREHTQLHFIASINSREPGTDAIYFHTTSWDQQLDVLEQSDRVILCEDDDAKDLELLIALRKCLTPGKRIHTKLECSERTREFLKDETIFGSVNDIFTPDLVIRQRQDAMARRMHALYLEGAGTDTPTWEELSAFTKASNFAVADHLFTKIHILLPGETFTEITPALCAKAYKAYLATQETELDRYRRIEHERFMRFYELHNWVCAEKRDNTARTHPLLCPFDRLPENEKAKDDYAWAILGRLEDCP